MKKTLILTLALAFAGLCVPASAQTPVKDGIYVSDMRGVEEGTIWGMVPYDTPLYIGEGGGGGDCPCPKYEQYIHWWTNMCSLALGKETSVTGGGFNEGEPEDQYSVVIGPQSRSVGYGNSVYGHMTVGDGQRTVAIGKGSRASGLSSVAIGDVATTETNTWGAIAIGTGAIAANDGIDVGWSKPIAIGLKSEAHSGLAIGHHSFASNGLYTIAIGGAAHATNDAIQIGYGFNGRRGTCKIGNAYFVDVAGVSKAYKAAFAATTSISDFKATFLNYLDALVPYDDIVPSTTPPEYEEEPPVFSQLSVKEVVTVKEDSVWDAFSKVLNAVQALVLAIIGIFWAKGKNKPEDKPEEPVEPQKRKRK